MSRSARLAIIAAGVVLAIMAYVGIQVLDSGPRRDIFSDGPCFAGPVGSCTPGQ